MFSTTKNEEIPEIDFLSSSDSVGEKIEINSPSPNSSDWMFNSMPEILERIFQYVQPSDLLACRLVCHSWRCEVTKVKVKSLFSSPNHWEIQPEKLSQRTLFLHLNPSSDIKSFLNVLINPNALLPSRHLKIGKRIPTEELILVLEVIGNYLSTLEFQFSDLVRDFFPYICLPELCPQLVTLIIITDSIKPKHTDLFQFEMVVDQFPYLKNLELKQYTSYVNPASSRMVISIMDNAPNLQTFSIGVDFDLLETITLHLAERPVVLERLEALRMVGYDSLIENWNGLLLNIKWLNIWRNDLHGMTTEEFSGMLQGICGTLNRLEIFNIEPNDLDIEEPFQVYFPCKMLRLRKIVIDNIIKVHGSEKLELFECLPELKEFTYQMTSVKGLFMEQRKPLWNGLFPAPKSANANRFIHNNLTELTILTPLDYPGIIQEIKIKFPRLKILQLEIYGNILPVLVEELKVMDIEQLILEIDGLTEISEENCLGLLQGEESHLKMQSSLSDWKHLQMLSVSQRTNNQCFVPLDLVFQELLMVTNLRTLLLRNFTVTEELIVKLLQGSQIDFISLTGSKFEACDGSSIIQKIQQRFPSVKILYSENSAY